MTDKPHLSCSSLSLIAKCGEQYRFRYVDGLVRAPSASLIRGKAMHLGQAGTLQRKIDDGALMSDEEVIDITATGFDAEWSNTSVELSKEELAVGMTKTKDAARDAAVGLATLYNRYVAPAVDPESVERKLSVEVQGFPFDLLGYADVVEKDKTVRDSKTAGKAPSESLILDSLQAELYPMAIEAIDGTRPKYFKLDVMVEQITQRQHVELKRAVPDDDSALLRRMEAAAHVIEKGAFTPADPNWWGCSEKWCGYWELCPYGAAHRSSPVTKTIYKETK
jgi:hypothetical protein